MHCRVVQRDVWAAWRHPSVYISFHIDEPVLLNWVNRDDILLAVQIDRFQSQHPREPGPG